MSLISRIDALPIRAKVLCGTFAYGRTEEPEELGVLLRSVSAQMCTAIQFPTSPYQKVIAFHLSNYTRLAVVFNCTGRCS